MNNEKKAFERRDFIKSIGAGAMILSGSAAFASISELPGESASTEAMIYKVKNAMLAMQRASWEQGVAAQAFWEIGDNDLVYLMAKEAVLRQTEEGRLSVLYTDNGVTDPAASGEIVFQMAKLKGEKELIDANKKMLDYLLHKAPKSEDGIIYHILSGPEIWIDAIYMAPPYLCVAGHPKEAIKQIEGIRNYLWNPKMKLYSHRWHTGEKRFINEKFWGVGNGWAIASLARVIDDLPSTMRHERTQLIKYATDNINGCLKFLRSDGLFHDIIDDSNSFVETNLAQMVAYGIFRGIKSGWISAELLTKAMQMRKAAHAKVDEYGLVQGVCGAPHFNSPGWATEGQAFFILMESAYKKLSN